MEGNTALGASSPANPALHIPEPLSTTSAATSSSMVPTIEGFKPRQTVYVTHNTGVCVQTEG